MSKKMRLVFVSTMEGSPWGGSEFLWSSAALELCRLGHVVAANTCWWPTTPQPLEKLKQNGVLLRRRRPRTRWRRIMTLDADLEARYLRRIRPDLVVISQGTNWDGLPWLERCARLSIPYVSIAHAVLPWSWPDDNETEVLRERYLHAERAFFVSRGNLELCERQIGVEFGNARIVRNPFNVPYCSRLPWPADRTTSFAYVARLEAYLKGFDILFDVLAQPKWRERQLQIKVYGSGRHERGLKAERARRGLDCIEFAGVTSDPSEIWKNAHCLLLPSRAEGLPITIVEAMLCGRPSIVTNVAGNSELLEDGVTGFVSNSPTVSDFDDAMERAWSRRHEWEQIGLRAQQSVRRQIPENAGLAFAKELLSLLDS